MTRSEMDDIKLALEMLSKFFVKEINGVIDAVQILHERVEKLERQPRKSLKQKLKEKE